MGLSENAKKVYQRLYYAPNESSPTEVHERIARAVASVEPTDELQREMSEVYFTYLEDNKFRPNSPVLMNAGLDRHDGPAIMSACFVANLQDDLISIFDTAKEAGIIFSHGAGIGINWGALRPKDAPISTGGKASGPLSFMYMLEATARAVKSGGRTRRAAEHALMNIDHPDVREFIHCKDEEAYLRSMNLSVSLTDRFMTTGVSEAGVTLREIAESAWKTGEPGVLFIDRVNRDNTCPSFGRIEAVNPCLHGDTLVFDGDRLRRIGHVPNFRGKTFTTIYSGRKETIKLTFSNGGELICTPDHKLLTVEGWVEAKDCFGKALVAYDSDRVVDTDIEEYDDEWVLFGFLYGSSHHVYGEKTDIGIELSPPYGQDVVSFLVDHGFNMRMNGAFYHRMGTLFDNNGGYGHSMSDELAIMPLDRKLPYWVIESDYVRVGSFLRGLFSADSGIMYGDRIVLSVANKDLAEGIRLLLSLFGIMSDIVVEGVNEVKWDNRVYEYHRSYNLSISDAGSLRCFRRFIGFIDGGKNRDLDELLRHKKNADLQGLPTVRVTSIAEAGQADVYDFKMADSKRYSMANGVIVHNCGEQPLLPYQSCCLASINVAAHLNDRRRFNPNSFRETVHVVTRFLDSVITLSGYPTADYERMAHETRPIGIGIMGFADLLAILGIPYGGSAGCDMARVIMQLLTTSAIEESIRLGKERGIAPALEHEQNKEAISRVVKTLTGITLKDMPRNTQWSTIAPTGTVAISCDCSAGMEPFFALSYDKTLSDTGEVMRFVNPIFRELYRPASWYKDAIEYIVDNHGSLQGGPVPEEVQKRFLVAHDIEWRDRLHMQAAFQQFTSAGISSTINLPADTDVDTIEGIYKTAFTLGLKGVTVFRDGCRGGEQPIAFGKKDTDDDEYVKVVERRIMVKRPPVVEGVTHKVKTGHGNIYLTVNKNHRGDVMEVFANGGKNGSTNAANLEAITRLLSVSLQDGVPLERLSKTLLGLSDHTHVWARLSEDDDKPVSIRGIPDAVAKVLLRFYSDSGLPEEPSDPSAVCTVCGGRLVYQEGCSVCLDCGDSKCS